MPLPTGPTSENKEDNNYSPQTTSHRDPQAQNKACHYRPSPEGQVQHPNSDAAVGPSLNCVDHRFQQDLAVFRNDSDQEKLRRINIPNDLHNALSSQVYLKHMCNDLAEGTVRGDIEEFLRKHDLVGSVRMEDIEHEKGRDIRAMKRALLEEMCHVQGEQLNPRVLLAKSHDFRLRAMYDLLCKSFIELLESKK